MLYWYTIYPLTPGASSHVNLILFVPVLAFIPVTSGTTGSFVSGSGVVSAGACVGTTGAGVTTGVTAGVGAGVAGTGVVVAGSGVAGSGVAGTGVAGSGVTTSGI